MNKLYTFLFFCLLQTFCNAQDFYNLNTIQSIKIIFKEENWETLLNAQKEGDENYLMAQSVTINESKFDSVGVKYKGHSTYKPFNKKNPFHIELDNYKDQKYQGYSDIKLSNVDNDPSFVREVLSYQIIRQYMDAPLSNYAKVYVNGVYIGLYTNTESISKKFLKNHFGSKNNTFIKCNPPEGAGPHSSQYPNLTYLGTDSTAYVKAYEMKSDYGWNELIQLCDTLNNNITGIEKILDVDRTLWMLAFDNATVNLDSYLGIFSQNYYLYQDDNNRFIPVIWDLNESFGRFSQAGSLDLNSTAEKQKISPLLNASNDNYPLLKNLLSIPMYKRMYLAHLKTILLENFANKSYYKTGQKLHKTIDEAVKADKNKHYTYHNFKANLTSDITGRTNASGGSLPPGAPGGMRGPGNGPPPGIPGGMRGSGNGPPPGIPGKIREPISGIAPGSMKMGGLVNNKMPGLPRGMRGPGNNSIPGITQLMDKRSAYLLNQTELSNSAPLISEIKLSDPNPQMNTTISITSRISNSSAVYLGYRSNPQKPFTRMMMHDDGTHGDQKANDGIFSASITVDHPLAQYYIYAENANAGIFSPQRAEHEFYSITSNTLPGRH